MLFDADIYAVLNAISVINEAMGKINNAPGNITEHHEKLACSLVEYAHTILEFSLPIVGDRSASDIAIDRMFE